MIVLIESPHKARKLSSILRSANIEARVIASNGRLFDLPERSLGITDSLTAAAFEPVDKEHFNAIHHELVSPEELVVASDPDEEGDLIAWTIKRFRDGLPTTRASFSDLNPPAVIRAFEELQSIPSQEPPVLARRIFDRLLGYSGTDGMFLSRTAGTVLRAAADFTIPTRKVVHSRRHGDLMLFRESRFNFDGREVEGDSTAQAPTSLPTLRHCLQVAADLKARPSEAFRALQEIYIEGDISYFRTDSGNVTDAALSAFKEVGRETAFDFQLRQTDQPTGHPHPGIYATNGKGFEPSLRDVTPLAAELRQRILNATLAVMAGPDRSVGKTNIDGELWQAYQVLTRGDVFTYPLTGHCLETDIIHGEPLSRKSSIDIPIGKENALAEVLMRSNVGHPSSWANLAQNYACLADRQGRLSSRGSEFFRKHQMEAPALLDPEIARQIEIELLRSDVPTPEKLKTAFDLCDLSPEKLNVELEPTPAQNFSISFSPS